MANVTAKQMRDAPSLDAAVALLVDAGADPVYAVEVAALERGESTGDLEAFDSIDDIP